MGKPSVRVVWAALGPAVLAWPAVTSGDPCSDTRSNISPGRCCDGLFTWDFGDGTHSGT